MATRRNLRPSLTAPAYFNRELSWLAFNRRVLEQAQDPRHPLLERVRFLTIFSNNLDEFFQIRVAGLMQQTDSSLNEPGPDGLAPEEQLHRVLHVVRELVGVQYRCWHDELLPALAGEGILFRTAAELTTAEVRWVRSYFRRQVLPVLTPLAVDPTHPFPHVGNKTLNLVVALDSPEQIGPVTRRLAILPVPRVLPRLVPLAPSRRGPQRHIFLSEILKLCAGELFPGYHLVGAHAFRVTRNSDLYIDDEESANLLKRIEEELRNLRRGAAVRLEIEAGVDDVTFTTISKHLNLERDYVFRLPAPVNLLRLQSLLDLDRPGLKFPPFNPVEASPLRDTARFFDVLRERDVLLHHPYDSFNPVVALVEQAARDPLVYAIKQTLYRTSGDSPIVRALIEASQNGKQVTALVELKARFDEANNIQWAKQLEEAGVNVVYGVLGLKTHCKLCLVVRREAGRMRHYAHLGTGNYNPRTARVYTDLSYFTTRRGITSDVARLFNALTGFGRNPRFRHLLVAPQGLHRRIMDLIARETAHAAAGRPGRIIAKMNSLVDQAAIDALYTASQAGVKIDLIVRGTCCLVPGRRGLSENIRVRSIVGRFLEHARVYFFGNAGGEPVILAGSADWMPRNFFRRVEVVFPVEDPKLRDWITHELLPAELRDNEHARVLHHSGDWTPVARRPGTAPFAAQMHFMTSALRRGTE